MSEDSKHFHRCGHRGSSEVANEGQRGCGWIWEHEQLDPDVIGQAAYDARHMCPNCGNGPWKRKHFEDKDQAELEEIVERLETLLSADVIELHVVEFSLEDLLFGGKRT